MNFTREQEEYLIVKYEPMLRKSVRAFMNRSVSYDHGRSEYEDLLQEARIGLLEHIRTERFHTYYFDEGGKERGTCVPWSVKSRMYQYAVRNSVVRMPANVFFKQVNKFQYVTDDATHRIPSDDEDFTAAIEVEAFLSTLEKPVRDTILKRMHGDKCYDPNGENALRDRNRCVSHQRRARRAYHMYTTGNWH